MFIAIVNASTRLSDTDAQLMTRAVHKQVRYHAGPAWAVHAPPVVFTGHVDPTSEPADGSMLVPAIVPPGSYVIGLFDTDAVPDALGWHSEGSDGTVFGRVNVGAVLDNGGTPLTGSTLTVASVLSHEVLEALVDPQVDRWAQAPDGRLWAVEVGDPVESWSYDVKIDGQVVTVSDFVLPAWFDDTPAPGATHWADEAHGAVPPFTLAPGGYAVVWAAGGQPQQVFADGYPEWRKASKNARLARTAQRLAAS